MWLSNIAKKNRWASGRFPCRLSSAWACIGRGCFWPCSAPASCFVPLWRHGAGGVIVHPPLAFMAATLMCYTLFMKQIRPYFRTQKDRRRIRFIAAVSVSAGLLCVALGALLGSYAVGIACCVGGRHCVGRGLSGAAYELRACRSACATRRRRLCSLRCRVL